MIRVAVGVLLLLGAHFAGAYLVPASAGKARFYWPWAHDPVRWALLGERGPLLPIGWQVLQPVAVVAALAYVGAFLALFGWLVPADWMQSLSVVGAIASLALYAIHPGALAIMPVFLDAIVLWGVLGAGWTPAQLAGS